MSDEGFVALDNREAEDKKIVNAFDQGKACARKGGFLSDNPHAYESERWESWRLGFYEPLANFARR